MTAPFDPERELHRHGASLRGLAAALLGNGHDADDAVQDTWQAAMERQPSGEAGGWLHTVLRHFAFRRRRGEVRRTRREVRAARPETVAAAGDDAARREMLRILVDAVLALEEPYQTTIWQRFFEQREPALIAARSGVALATVKSRLQRGLALLRRRLDRSAGRNGWRPALAGAFGLEHLVATTAAATSVATGALLMGTGAKFALGGTAAVLFAAVVFVISGNHRPAPVGPTDTVAEAETATAAVHSEGDAAEPDVPADRTEVAAAEIPDLLRHPFTYELHCTVVDRDGLPVAGAEVFVSPLLCSLNKWNVTSGDDGTTTVHWRGRQGEMAIALGVRGNGETSLRRLDVQAGRTQVVVTGKTGRISGVWRLALSDGNRLVAGGSAGARSMSFTLYRAATADPGNPHQWLGEGQDCRACHDSTTLFRDAFGGAPQMGPGLHPHADFAEAMRPRVAPAQETRVASLDLVIRGTEFAAVDSGLRFLSRGNVPAVRFSQQLLVDFAEVQGGLHTAAEPTVVEGIVYGEDGKPAARTTVVVGRELDRAIQRARTNAEGRFRLESPHIQGWVELRAGGGNDGLRRTRMFLQEGQVNPWNPVLERCSRLRGRAVDADGASLEGWVVELEGRDWADECTVQKDGTFELPNLPAGPFRLLLWPKDGTRQLPALVRDSLLPDSGDVLLALPKERGRLQVTPFLPPGMVDVPVEVRVFQVQSRRGAALKRADKGDVFAAEGLPAGWYHVLVGAEGLGWQDLGQQWVDGQGACDLGKVALSAGGRLRVVQKAADLPAEDQRTAELCIRRPEADVRTSYLPDGGGLEVPQGDYVYLWRDRDGLLRHSMATVRPGQETVLDLR